jgi:hypothetical protein
MKIKCYFGRLIIRNGRPVLVIFEILKARTEQNKLSLHNPSFKFAVSSVAATSLRVSDVACVACVARHVVVNCE